MFSSLCSTLASASRGLFWFSLSSRRGKEILVASSRSETCETFVISPPAPLLLLRYLSRSVRDAGTRAAGALPISHQWKRSRASRAVLGRKLHAAAVSIVPASGKAVTDSHPAVTKFMTDYWHHSVKVTLLFFLHARVRLRRGWGWYSTG